MNAKHRGAAKLWWLNLFGNAALIAAFYFWLLLPDAHGWQVAGSALLALMVIFLGLWLRAGSFAYFRVAEFRDHATVWWAFRHALRHILALLLWLIPLAVVEWRLLSLRRYLPQSGVWFWQKSPSLLRLSSPRATFHTAECILWIVILVLLPIVWLPVASTVAAFGFSTVSRSWRVLRRPGYWAWYVVLILIGGYIPYRLVWWIPDLSTLRKQAWSAGLRLAPAYLLLITAWVALLLVVGSRVEKEDPRIVDVTNS